MRKYYPYPTRDPIKDYFPLPNEIRMLGLTPGEFTVYSYLMQCEDRRWSLAPSSRPQSPAVRGFSGGRPGGRKTELTRFWVVVTG